MSSANGPIIKVPNGERGLMTPSVRRGREPLYKFKSEKMQQQYQQFVDDPDRLDMTHEMALCRMVLDSTVKQLKAESPETMSAEERAMLLLVVKEVGDMTEQMGRVQKLHNNSITPEHIKLVMEQMIKLMQKHVPWKILEKIIHEFDNIDLPMHKLTEGEVINDEDA